MFAPRSRTNCSKISVAGVTPESGIAFAAPGLEQCIDAPGAAARRGQKKKDEAVEHSQLSLVERRRQDVTFLRMHREISHRHLSGQNERNGTREQSNKQQRSPNDLHQASNAGNGQQTDLVEHCDVWHVEQLGGPMLQIEKPTHQTQRRKSCGSPSPEELLTQRHGMLLGKTGQAWRSLDHEHRHPSAEMKV